jgi:hypothetical protein
MRVTSVNHPAGWQVENVRLENKMCYMKNSSKSRLKSKAKGCQGFGKPYLRNTRYKGAG